MWGGVMLGGHVGVMLGGDAGVMFGPCWVPCVWNYSAASISFVKKGALDLANKSMSLIRPSPIG